MDLLVHKKHWKIHNLYSSNRKEFTRTEVTRGYKNW